MTEEERKRFHKLEDLALNAMAEEVNFVVTDWLTKEEQEEYNKLKELYFNS